MMCELEVAKHIVPENSILRKIVFDEEFQGEQLVTEGKSMNFQKKNVILYCRKAFEEGCWKSSSQGN